MRPSELIQSPTRLLIQIVALHDQSSRKNVCPPIDAVWTYSLVHLGGLTVKLALRDRRIKVSSAPGQIMSALSGNDRSGELTGFAKRSPFNHIAGSNLRQLLPPPDSDKL